MRKQSAAAGQGRSDISNWRHEDQKRDKKSFLLKGMFARVYNISIYTFLRIKEQQNIF